MTQPADYPYYMWICIVCLVLFHISSSSSQPIVECLCPCKQRENQLVYIKRVSSVVTRHQQGILSRKAQRPDTGPVYTNISRLIWPTVYGWDPGRRLESLSWDWLPAIGGGEAPGCTGNSGWRVGRAGAGGGPLWAATRAGGGGAVGVQRWPRADVLRPPSLHIVLHHLNL